MPRFVIGCNIGLAVLLLASALVLAQSSDVLNMDLTAKRVTDPKGPKAVGVAVISNPTNKAQLVGKVKFDIRFMMKDMDVHKDDIRQQFDMTHCSGQKLPFKLAPGAKLECPCTSRANIYGGKISVVAGAVKPNVQYDGDWMAFGVINEVMPEQTGPKTYKAVESANIPGQDISCGQTDQAGKPQVFCKICGGKAAVEAACNKRAECVAYDMEGSSCGYLKTSQGPMKKPAPGFVSWLLNLKP